MYIAKTDKWYLERILFFVAGVLILLSLALTYFISKYWLILAGIMGLNLILFATTGFCTVANVLVKIGAKSNSCNCGGNCNCRN